MDRVADGADHPPLQVFASADVIDHLLPDRVVEEAIHGEVAPQGVFPGVAETDALGMAAVVVLIVAAEGGYLDLAGAAVALHRNYPVGGADGQRPPVAEQRADLFGPGIGGHVVVFGRAVQEQVADASTRPKRRVPGAAELPHHLHGEIAMFFRQEFEHDGRKDKGTPRKPILTSLTFQLCPSAPTPSGENRRIWRLLPPPRELDG